MAGGGLEAVLVGNLTARLQGIEDEAAVVDELYLNILTRLPNEEEKEFVATFLQENAGRKNAALDELAWSLLTTAEFRLNH